VKPARRRGWRTLRRQLAKYSLVAALIAFGLYQGGVVAAETGLLQIDRIVVHGNERLTTGEVLEMLNGLQGESLVWANLETWRQRLLASPWVQDASIRRSLPSTIEVEMSEREPIGLGRIQGELYLVDGQGVVIDQYGPQYSDLDLPIVDGLSSKNGEEVTADPARAELAARLIASLAVSPTVTKRLSQVDVTDLRNAAVILEGDPAVLYVGDDRFLPRLQSYVDLAEAIKARVPEVDYVDLRFDDRVYVRPVGNRGRSAILARAGER
jgi:cell division septal protein FtsQ